MDGRRRHAFTLVEILVCFALLTLLGSLVCFQGMRTIQEFRFQRAVKSLKEELRFASHLSLTAKSDIVLSLGWEKGKLVGAYLLEEIDNPLLKGKRSFEGIRFVTVNGAPLAGVAVLTFSSTERVSSQEMQICVASATSEPVCLRI